MERCYSPLDRRGRKDPETRSKRYFRSVTTERLQCYLLRMHRTQCHVKRDWPCDEQKEYREGLGSGAFCLVSCLITEVTEQR